MSTDSEILVDAEETTPDVKKESHTMQVITWFSVGMAVAAVGIFLGREMHIRYKFKHRTPYDFYARAGEQTASEFGVGI